MDFFESYSFLLIDNFYANLCFTFASPLALYAMRSFGFNVYYLLLGAILSWAGAALVNFFSGKLCYKIFQNYNNDSSHNIKTVQNHPFLPLMLLLSGTEFFGNFIVFFAGFSYIPLRKTLIYATLGKFIYYSYFLFI